MDQNPYQPPDSELEPGGPPPRNSTGWRVFFWISAGLVGLGVLAVPFIDNLTLLDLVDFGTSIVAVVGLFGFAYYRRIGGVVFWRYFFYFALLESFVFVILLPLIGAERYGEPTGMDGFYLFEIVYAYLILSALYFYAYRREFVWSRRPR